jgi:predicted nucleotidyltransferase
MFSYLRTVLIGSHTRRKPKPYRDLDLLIIEDSDLTRYKRPVRYLQTLIGLYPEKDVVVWTPAEIQEWANVPNPFNRIRWYKKSPLLRRGFL